MAESHQLAVTRMARYCTLGEMSERTRHVWFVLHGYGQLAEYFIRSFKNIQDDETYIVAPEALSRFYLKDHAERVGASWMTRETRESEIDDYVAYLDTLYQTVFKAHSPENIRVTVLGFSQGTATACRWLDRGQLRCDRLILWAGYFANGLTGVVANDRLPADDTHFIYGNRDMYLTQFDTARYLENLKDSVPFLQIKSYEGGHSIDPEVLVREFDC